MDNVIHVGDEVDESKFFAGVFTSQRSEEDLVGYVKNCLSKRSDFDIIIIVINTFFFYQISYVLQRTGQFAITIAHCRNVECQANRSLLSGG